MQLPESAIKEFQVIWKKEYGKDLSYDEAAQSAHSLISLLEICREGHIEELRRKDKLKEFPNGYIINDRGYPCSICNQRTGDEGAWYDKYGFKCSTCQKGIDKKQIPASMAKKEEAWYSCYDMESRFNIKKPTLRKWIKADILKARSIMREDGSTHVQIFLIKDNKDFLPPKNLTKSELVQEDVDGKTRVHSEPWYRFVDPFKHLEGYKIMDYMDWTESAKNNILKQIEPLLYSNFKSFVFIKHSDRVK